MLNVFSRFKIVFFSFSVVILPACTNGILNTAFLSSDLSSLQYTCPVQAFILNKPSSNVLRSSVFGVRFTVSPALPPGLSLDSSTGTISGTPTSITVLTPYIVSASSGGTTTTTLVNIKTDNGYLVNDLGDATDFGAGNSICETGAGNGVCTLRAAIVEIMAAVSPPTVVVLSPGIVTLTSVLPTISKPIDFFGNCSSSSSVAIVDGVGLYSIFNIITGPGSLNSLVVQNGFKATGGAGVNITGAVTYGLQSVLVQNNTNTTGNGAGVAQGPGTLTITASKIQNNSGCGPCYGGGISSSGTLNISQSIITGNSSGSGGGVYIGGGSMTASTTIFSNNFTTTGGGGVFYYGGGGASTITNSNLSGNTSASQGGIIYLNSAGTMNITNSNLYSNTALGGGVAALFVAGATLNVVQSSVLSNTATAAATGGGAFYISAGTVNVSNSTISGNQATGGTGIGGVAYLTAAGATLVAKNNTVVGNTAGSPGSGGFVHRTAGSYSYGNNIIYQNYANGALADCNSATGTSLGYNILDNISCANGSDFIGANPLLGTLQNNGGFTPTMIPQAGSPAINAGLAATCSAGPVSSVDQVGRSRLLDTFCDIGAYETIP